MKVQEGNLLGSGKKFAIIGSRFNEFITSKLIGGAEDCLLRHDVKEEDITVIWVPGAYEIPLIAKKAASSGRFDAVICVGAVKDTGRNGVAVQTNQEIEEGGTVTDDDGLLVMLLGEDLF